MWCPTCQQDVPGYGSADGRELRCGKCGENLPGAIQPYGSLQMAKAAADEAKMQPVRDTDVKQLLRGGPADEDWALEAELRGAQRLIGSLKSRSTIVAEPLAVHSSHVAPARWHMPTDTAHGTAVTVQARPSNPHPKSDATQPRSHAAAWAVLCSGVTVLACGIVLVGFSVISARADLWQIGLPAVVVGQAALIIGFALQLDGLWPTNPKQSAAEDVGGESPRTEYPTSGVQATSGAPLASPHVLLSELKSQLDRLVQHPSPPERG
jgi:hypothetical protein